MSLVTRPQEPNDQPGPGATQQPEVSPQPRRGRRFIVFAVILVAAGAAAAVYWQRNTLNRQRSTAQSTRSLRTHQVRNGVVEKTLRLTGSTAAENFVSLIAPQLRGSRSGGGRDYNSRRSSTSTQSAEVASTATTSNSLARATNASSSSRSSSGGSSSSSAAASTIADTGSTASSLPSSGGGGGGDDFSLILQKLVSPGSIVKKGDVVAEFDRQNMLLRLDDYRASVRQQELDMTNLMASLGVTKVKRKQNIENAKAQVEKAKLDLKTMPVRSEIQSERYKLALEEAEARWKQLLTEVPYADASDKSAVRKEELDFQRAQLEYKRAEMNADRMISKASIEGMTVMQNTVRGTDFAKIQQGDQLSPGQFFMQIVDTRSMVVNALVNQVDAEALRIGQKARVRFDAYPDLELPARVYSIGAMTKAGGLRAAFVKEVPVKLRIEKLDPRVIPDLSVAAEVIIDSETAESAIVPLEGVFSDPGATTTYVFARTETGWQRREVTVGKKNNIWTAIRSGVKAGEVIALGRPPEPENGQNLVASAAGN